MEIINGSFLYIERHYYEGYVLIKIDDIISIEDNDDNVTSKIDYKCLNKIKSYYVKHSVKEIVDVLQNNMKNN